MIDVDILAHVTPNTVILRVNTSRTSWISDELIPTGTIALGLTYGENRYRIFKLSERELISNILNDPDLHSRVHELESVTEPIELSGECIQCGTDLRLGADIISLSELELVPEVWIHKGCISSFSKSLQFDVTEYTPQITAENI